MDDRYIFIRICRGHTVTDINTENISYHIKAHIWIHQNNRIIYRHRYGVTRNIVFYTGSDTESPQISYHIQAQIQSHQKYRILYRLRYRVTRNIVSYTGSDTESPKILYQAQLRINQKHPLVYSTYWTEGEAILAVSLANSKGHQFRPLMSVCVCILSVCVSVSYINKYRVLKSCHSNSLNKLG